MGNPMGRSRGPEGYLRPVKVTRPPVAANPNVSSRLHRVRPPELLKHLDYTY